MKETFETVKEGDRLSASEYNKLTNAVTGLGSIGPPYGQQAVDLGGINSQLNPRADITMVRITATVVPQSSELYTDSLLYQEDVNGEVGDDSDNAVVQVWDDDISAWSDDPQGETVTVIVPDDGTGWRPLVENDIIPVIWKKNTGAYVPLEARETAVVMMTSLTPDAQGFYNGVTIGYDSDAGAWVTQQPCYILDVGS